MKNDWKLGGGRGARGRRVGYFGTEVRCTYQSGEDHGEKKKADETGLELIVVKELLEAIALAHIVALF